MAGPWDRFRNRTQEESSTPAPGAPWERFQSQESSRQAPDQPSQPEIPDVRARGTGLDSVVPQRRPLTDEARDARDRENLTPRPPAPPRPPSAPRQDPDIMRRGRGDGPTPDMPTPAAPRSMPDAGGFSADPEVAARDAFSQYSGRGPGYANPMREAELLAEANPRRIRPEQRPDQPAPRQPSPPRADNDPLVAERAQLQSVIAREGIFVPEGRAAQLRLAEIESELAAQAAPIASTPVPGPTEEQTAQPFGDLASRAGRGLTSTGAGVLAGGSIAEGLPARGFPEMQSEPGRVLQERRNQLEFTNGILRTGVAPSGVPLTAQEQDELRQNADRLTTEIGRLEIQVGALEQNPPETLGESVSFQGADAFRQRGLEVFGIPDAQFDDRFISTLAEGGGNMVGFLLAGALTGPVGVAATGAAFNAESLYREAIAAGADEETARRSANLGSLVGASEVVPIMSALRPLERFMPGISNSVARAVVRRIGGSATEEAIQEGAAQVANNLIAQGLYDPDRGFADGVTEAMLVGAILGGVMGAGGAVIAPEARTGPPPAITPNDPERLGSQRLSQADRDSAIPNDVIDDGRATLEAAVTGAPLPPVQPTGLGAATDPPDVMSNLPQVGPNPTPGSVQPDPPLAPEQPAPVAQAAPQGLGTATQPEAPQVDTSPAPGRRLGEVMSVVDGDADVPDQFVAQDLDTGEIVEVTADGAPIAPPAAPVEQPAAAAPLRLDNPLPAADVAADATPAPVAPVAAAPVERPAPAAPAAVAPPAAPDIPRRTIRADTAVTPTGREVPVEFAVVEAASLITSNLDDGRVNPAYPASLQPRDRGRGTSMEQVRSIARNLNPRLLGEGPTATDGAPIISADGVVESGNGRTMALRQAYGTDAGERYRQFLSDQGYDIEGLSQPVLVRVRQGEMTPEDRQAFTREANTRTTASMSATEQALADGESMTDNMVGLYRGGDIDGPGNRDFVRSFIGNVVPEAERGQMIDASGAMSQDATRRIQGALLARAYGDANLITALIESSDSSIKSIGGALMDVSAEWAQMRAEARAGTINEGVDLTAPLIEAVRLVDRARREKRNVAEFVGQADMLSGTGISAEGELFLRLMFRNTDQWTQATGRDRLAGALRFYAEEARKTSAGVDMFGDQVDPSDILTSARERQFGDETPEADLFASRPRPAGQDSGTPGRDRQDAQQDGTVPVAGGRSQVAGDGPAAGTSSQDVAPQTDSNGRPVSSWVVINRQTGESLGEFQDKNNIDEIRFETFEPVPVADYLVTLNQSIRDNGGTDQGIDKPSLFKEIAESARARREGTPQATGQADNQGAAAVTPATPTATPTSSVTASSQTRRAIDTLSTDERARLAAIGKQLADKLRNQTNVGLDPELVSLAVEAATIYVKAGVRRFREIIAALADATGLPISVLGRYARLAYNDVRDEMEASGEAVADMDDSRAVIAELARLNREERENAPSTGGDLERDSGNPEPANDMGAANVPASTGRDGAGAGTRGNTAGGGGGRRRTGGGRVPSSDAIGVGGRGDRAVQRSERTDTESATDPDSAGSRDRGQQRLPDDQGTAANTEQNAQDGTNLTDRRAAQKRADSITPIEADEANIRETLPLLLPEQQDDVLKVERRFAKPDSFGMLLTNGTGTGKTYSGGGVIKRMAQQGKDNILILAPSQGILDAWVSMGTDLGLNITKLSDTSDAGTGIVAATYANALANNALSSRPWDLVVPDESHNLSSNQAGQSTGALATLRAITNHPDGIYQKAYNQLGDEWATAKALPEGAARDAKIRDLYTRTRAKQEEIAKEPRGRVLFLSATPFAYDKSTDYAAGYLFEYPGDGITDSGSRQTGQSLFMVQNFGYRIRYHKLTKPEAAVDGGVFEREFHERLKTNGALSGRSLSIEADYDRRFVSINSEIGNQIDQALDYLSEKSRQDTPDRNSWGQLDGIITKQFRYLQRMQLLEAIKAEQVMPDIRKHLSMNRKVVVFHDFNIGGGRSPFELDLDESAPYWSQYQEFLRDNPYVSNLNFAGLLPPKDAITAEFGDRAREYNGTVTNKERTAARNAFQADGSGVDVLVVQSAAGESGISLHDTTDVHQRVLINLGMPTRPVTTLQQEGRIRRVGSLSDAIFRYYTIGTAWERDAFARRIAEKSGTVENLALGNEARSIRESFIDAYSEADTHAPGMDGEGKGGKDRDRTVALSSPYDQAKTHYFGRQKNTRNRANRQGVDFYATPEPLGFKMVQWAASREYEKVLEPSAGDGAIARYFQGNTDRTIIEPSYNLSTQAQLRAGGARSVNGRFEEYHINNKHDVIVMNPPFGVGGKTAFEHVAKAMTHLRPGGRIVALVPRGPAADKNMGKLFASDQIKAEEFQLTALIDLPSVTFEKAGTGVSTTVMIMDRVMEMPRTSTMEINLRGAQDIGEFFDRLENIDVPMRPPQMVEPGAIAEMSNAADDAALSIEIPAVAEAAGGVETFQFEHSKTGEMQYGANARERVTRDQYDAMKAEAAKFRGHWSSYRNNETGARRGFLFKFQSDRDAFVESMQRPSTVKEQRALSMLDDNSPTEGVFYSPLLRAVQNAKQNQAPAADWRAILSKMPGVKQIEMEWIGVYDWLESQDGAQVPRSALEQFVRDGQISMVEDRLEEGYEAPDFVIAVDFNNPIEPDWESEAELYFDEARQELEDRLDEDEDLDEISEADVQQRAEELAREQWKPSEFAVDVFDANDSGYRSEGYFDNDMRTYTFPDLDVFQGEELDVTMAAEKYWENRVDGAGDVDGRATFEDYTEDGGDNYREVLIRVPNLHKSGRNMPARRGITESSDPLEQTPFDENRKEPFVQSSHFYQENVVVHARLKDRKGPNGERVLFVEEIQSDLASKWRENTEATEVTAQRRELTKQGQAADAAREYAQREVWIAMRKADRPIDIAYAPAKADGSQTRYSDLPRSGNNLRYMAQSLTWDSDQISASQLSLEQGEFGAVAEAMGGLVWGDKALRDTVRDYAEKADTAANLESEILNLGTARSVDTSLADTPFKEEHSYALMVKRLLREAAEKGYDSLAWTPGYMQAERWDKAAQSVVENVQWKPGENNRKHVIIDMAQGGQIYDLYVDQDGMIGEGSVAMLQGKTLRAVVGPAVAKQVFEMESGEVTGQRITFSDSGYSIAYDQQIKSAVNKIAKGTGAQVEQVRDLPDMRGRPDSDIKAMSMRGAITGEEAMARIGRERITPDMNAERQIGINDSYGRSPGSMSEDQANVLIALRSAMTAGKLDIFEDVFPSLAGERKPVWSITITPELREKALAPQPILQKPVYDGPATLMDETTVREILPGFRERLNKMGLDRVRLGIDLTGQRQGAILINRIGPMDIVIGASINPKATLYHEAIHALRVMDVFTDQEWTRLTQRAEGTWIEKHDIEGRYPDLTREEQVEEAIAEEFGAWASGQDENPGGIRMTFKKMQRFFEALYSAMTGRGFFSADDVFGKALSGEIVKRHAGNTGSRRRMYDVDTGVDFAEEMTAQRDQADTEAGTDMYEREQRPTRAVRPLSAAGRQKIAQATNSSHIPDRRIFEELARRNVSVLDRMGGSRAALMDRVDRSRITLQDKMLPFLRAEQGIMATTGEDITKAESAYFTEERYSGRVGHRLDRIDDEYTKPIVRAVSDANNSKDGAIRLADKDGMVRSGAEAVGLWLTARHASERNARIAAINPNMPDGGAGMSTAEASAILAEASGSPHAKRLDAIGAMIDRLGQEMINWREEAGLMTADEANTWRRMYKRYVPLRGFAETEMFDLVVNEYSGIGRRYNIRGQESQAALGRGSEAYNPLAMILTMAQEVTIRAEKNLVGQSAVKLAQRFPNPAMWTVSRPEAQRVFNRTTGLVETRVVGPLARPLGNNEMAVKIDGIEHRLRLDDPRLARSMGQLGDESMGVFMRAMSGFSRYFSAVNTMLSPPFVVVNAIRDMMTAQVNIGEQVPKGMQAKVRTAVLRNYTRSLAGSYRGLAGDSSTQWSQYFKEYSQIGAKVHFWRIDSPEQQFVDMDQRINLATGNIASRTMRRLVKPSTRDNPALAWIERVNLAIDNSARLSAFVEARAQGMTIEDAASLSKNLTVNFNRKGEIGPQMNALFPFANAAIQGSQVLLKAMSARQVKGIVLGMVVFGMLNDLLNASLSEEDDDGELEYDQIPNFVQQRNLILANPAGDGETFITVPLPYGYNAFFYLGNRLGKLTRGVVDPGRATRDVMTTTLSAFSPLSGETAQQFFMPTLLDHVNELAQNRNWIGRPIRPENPYGDYGPQSFMEYNASGPSRVVARGLNSITGGSQLERGLIDISPEYLDHTREFLTGGAGRFVGQVYELGEAAVQGRLQDVEVYQVPILRNLRTDSGPFLNSNRFFRFRDVVNESRAMVVRAQELDIPVLDRHQRAARLHDALRGVERQRTSLRNRLDLIYADTSLTAAERADALRPVRDQLGAVYVRFNGLFIAAMGPQGE